MGPAAALLRRLLPAVLVAALAAPLPARLAAQGLEMSISPILIIDQERLFAESHLGEQIGREMEAKTEALAAENRRIEAELIAEEQALTERRKELPAAEFRVLAENFDAKVQRIRAEQDAKERDLQHEREQAQARFLGRIVPILGQLAAERGAVAILDRRTVFLAADSIDITEQAIARINALIAAEEEGTPDPETPAPEAPPEQ